MICLLDYYMATKNTFEEYLVQQENAHNQVQIQNYIHMIKILF